MKLDFFIYIIYNILFQYINLINIKKKNLYKLNEIIFYFKQYIILYNSIKILKKNSLCQFQILNDICVIDNPINVIRFSLIYNLFSIIFNIRIFLKIFITEVNYLESINNLYRNSVWLEREVWDMFGIFFYNNIDLRRLLSDYGFDGYPLRKDFPLTGYIELRYNDSLSSLYYEPVELTQDYRLFTFNSPWEYIEKNNI